MSTTSRLLRSDADTAGAARTYLYGVVRRADVRAIRSEGVAGAGIVSIDHGEIAALTSAIPGTGEIRARRRDLLRHSDVLQEAFAAGPVVPLRFGTVAASASSVVDDLLAPRHGELLDLLEAFDGLAELSVRAFYREEEVLGALVREDVRVGRLREAARAEGATRQLQLELGEAVAKALERKRARDADAVLNAVERVAQEISIQERGNELEVLRASVLVDRRDVPRVDRALDELARSRARDMLFKYLGPLPPHSFVSLRFGAG